MRAIFLSLGLLCAPALAHAQCSGTNLLTQMPAANRAALESAAHAAPFAQGNLWQARKGDLQVTLAGTYHLDDPRHADLMAQLTPLLDQAKTVLVEAGPQEEAALKSALAKTPALMVLQDKTLPEVLSADDWDALSKALSRRGIPSVMAAKMQPWYVTVLLSIPPCLMATLDEQRGLDKRIIDHTLAQNIPLRPLEPYDTLFKIFEGLTLEDQLSMIRTALATEAQAEDYMATLADSYFTGDARMIWELTAKISADQPDITPEAAAHDLAKMERVMLTRRNTAWIGVIEEAASQGPVVAAFGALHLSGETGVAQLLADRGWSLQPITP